jgi:hypothetical protein
MLSLFLCMINNKKKFKFVVYNVSKGHAHLQTKKAHGGSG